MRTLRFNNIIFPIYQTLVASFFCLLSSGVEATGYWFDINDPSCSITWYDNNEIDYHNCKRFNFDGAYN
jgi:hypothetical protein